MNDEKEEISCTANSSCIEHVRVELVSSRFNVSTGLLLRLLVLASQVRHQVTSEGVDREVHLGFGGGRSCLIRTNYSRLFCSSLSSFDFSCPSEQIDRSIIQSIISTVRELTKCISHHA